MIGRARANDIARRLGTAALDARRSAGLRQADLAASAGISQSFVSRMERGQGRSASIETWASVAAACGTQLAAFLEVIPGATRPRDYEHLKRQQLVIEAARAGGWVGMIERPVDPAWGRSRSVDVRLDRAHGRQTVIAEI